MSVPTSCGCPGVGSPRAGLVPWGEGSLALGDPGVHKLKLENVIPSAPPTRCHPEERCDEGLQLPLLLLSLTNPKVGCPGFLALGDPDGRKSIPVFISRALVPSFQSSSLTRPCRSFRSPGLFCLLRNEKSHQGQTPPRSKFFQIENLARNPQASSFKRKNLQKHLWRGLGKNRRPVAQEPNSEFVLLATNFTA